MRIGVDCAEPVPPWTMAAYHGIVLALRISSTTSCPPSCPPSCPGSNTLRTAPGAPSTEVDLHHLRVVRNEGLCWLTWWGVHEETVEGFLHADETSEREGSLTCSNSPVKGKGLCAPCRSRCRGGEQSEDEGESVHYDSGFSCVKSVPRCPLWLCSCESVLVIVSPHERERRKTVRLSCQID